MQCLCVGALHGLADTRGRMVDAAPEVIPLKLALGHVVLRARGQARQCELVVFGGQQRAAAAQSGTPSMHRHHVVPRWLVPTMTCLVIVPGAVMGLFLLVQ